MKIHKEVKSTGKAYLILITYFTLFILYMIFINRMTVKEGGDFWENFLMSLIFFFPFSIAAMYLPLVWINKKNIPKSIKIDTENNSVEIGFFKKDPLQFELSDIAFHVVKNNFVYILIFYKKIVATRGHYVYKQFINIAGTQIPIAWKESDLIDLTNFMIDAGIEKHIPAKEKHISDYFFFE